MNLTLAWLTGWLACAFIMAVGWDWQRRHHRVGIVDVLWATGLGGNAVWLALIGHGQAMPRLLLAVCGGIWAWRLAYHLWRRLRREEDGRYLQLLARWHGHQGKLFIFFQVQATLIALFALPFIAVAGNTTPSINALLLGVVIWLVSLLGETVADHQLAQFRAQAKNHGKACRQGWWRYSRHPNYFFEWLHWFSYVCFAINAPLSWLAWLGPLLMYMFLRWTSGIPWTEAQALRTRGDDYRNYQHSTSMLFPWFPKNP